MNEIDKALGGAGLLTFARSEIGRRIFSPIADEAGKALGTFGEIYRFYQNECLGEIFTKWGASRGGRELTEDDVKKIMPLLQLASVQNEDELQDRWAALLENTVSEPQGVLPSFGQTLSQLTSEGGRFLDRLYDLATQPKDHLSEYRPTMGLFSRVSLINVYDESIQTGINPAEREFFKDRLGEEQIKNYERLTQAELIIQDSIRLGILNESQVGEVNRFIPSDDGGVIPLMSSRYSLSLYGVSFVRAVRPLATDH